MFLHTVQKSEMKDDLHFHIHISSIRIKQMMCKKMCSYKVVDGKCKLNIKCINYLTAMDSYGYFNQIQKALQSLNLLPAPHPPPFFFFFHFTPTLAHMRMTTMVFVSVALMPCVFFQENSEDDKKRGRSTDSEVSQVSVKMPKPLPENKQECRKLQEHHYLLRLS